MVSIEDTNHEILRAKYVVGCDGGHSTVRQQLDIQLEGEKTTEHFGVVDIVPLTDFRE
jgi:2-polyprenyl-6-methoxyphenol hydroxylase-like FAD-dependent oxidoreductase